MPSREASKRATWVVRMAENQECECAEPGHRGIEIARVPARQSVDLYAGGTPSCGRSGKVMWPRGPVRGRPRATGRAGAGPAIQNKMFGKTIGNREIRRYSLAAVSTRRAGLGRVAVVGVCAIALLGGCGRRQ